MPGAAFVDPAFVVVPGLAAAAVAAWLSVLATAAEEDCDPPEFAAEFTAAAVLAAEFATLAAFWTAFFFPKSDFRLETALARPSGAPAKLPTPGDTPFAKLSK